MRSGALLHALIFGWKLGCVVGLIDLLLGFQGTVVLHWYETYQAILLPALLVAMLFAAAALPLCFFSAFRRDQRIQRSVFWILTALLTLIVFSVGVMEQVAGRDELWVQVFFIFVLFGVGVLILARGVRLPLGAEKMIQPGLRVLSLLLIVTFLFDVIRFHSPVYERASNLRHDSSNAGTRRSVFLVASESHGALQQLEELFEIRQAYSNSLEYRPALASLLSGSFVYEHALTSPQGSLHADVSVVAERFASEGFRTVGIASSLTAHSASGFALGFHLYDDRFGFWQWRRLSQHWSLRSAFQHLADRAFSASFRFMRERPVDQLVERVRWHLKDNSQTPIFFFIHLGQAVSSAEMRQLLDVIEAAFHAHSDGKRPEGRDEHTDAHLAILVGLPRPPAQSLDASSHDQELTPKSFTVPIGLLAPAPLAQQPTDDDLLPHGLMGLHEVYGGLASFLVSGTAEDFHCAFSMTCDDATTFGVSEVYDSFADERLLRVFGWSKEWVLEIRLDRDLRESASVYSMHNTRATTTFAVTEDATEFQRQAAEVFELFPSPLQAVILSRFRLLPWEDM